MTSHPLEPNAPQLDAGNLTGFRVAGGGGGVALTHCPPGRVCLWWAVSEDGYASLSDLFEAARAHLDAGCE